jgi:hypothetical protein
MRNLTLTSRIHEHFMALRGLDEWDAEDGEAVGDVLVTKMDAEKHHEKVETRVEARVRATMEKQKGLKELGEKHEWIEVLLAKVVANKLRPAGESKGNLCNMSAKEAKVIGGALASCIAANLTAPAAVDEWILRYPAMGELDREYVRASEGAQKRARAAQRQLFVLAERSQKLAATAHQGPTPTTGANNCAGGAGERIGRARQRPRPTTLLLRSLRSRGNASDIFLLCCFARPPPFILLAP